MSRQDPNRKLSSVLLWLGMAPRTERTNHGTKGSPRTEERRIEGLENECIEKTIKESRRDNRQVENATLTMRDRVKIIFEAQRANINAIVEKRRLCC